MTERRSVRIARMVKEFGLTGDPELRGVTEVVHDIDRKDNKSNRTQAEGLNVILRGLSSLFRDERGLIPQASPIFDGLYQMLSDRSSDKPVEAKNGKRSSGRKIGKRRQTKRV